MVTWRESLQYAMTENHDPGPVVAYAPDETSFDVQFDDSYGGTNGPAVAAWTQTHVYFPVCYDGSEWLGSAPRNPQASGLDHQGG